MDYYQFDRIAAIYISSLLAGVFVLPAIFSGATLPRIVRAFNRFETGRRDRFFLPLTMVLARRNIHPNTVTIFGFLLTVLLAVGLWLAWSPTPLFAIAIVAGLSDMFDGMLARASGKVTSLGGALDGIRDGILLCVLTAGVFYRYGVVAPMIYFFSGVLFIEVLKFFEIIVRARDIGFRASALQRWAGVGKLSVDRVKFFLYISACLSFLLEEALFGSPIGLGSTILWAGIAVICVSIALHAAVMRLELRGESIIG